MSKRLVPPKLPAVFVPLVSRPVIDDFSLRASRQVNRAQPPNVPLGYPLPLRRHPMWSGNGEIGNTVNFAPDANNRQTVLKLEEWGEPTDWTVTLGMTGDYAQLGIVNRFDVTAVCDVGVGGATQRVEIDWLNGTSFSMPMNAINITAQYVTSGSGGSGGFQAPTDLQLTATLGRKSGGRVHAPTRSFVMNINPGSSLAANVPIPAFSKNVLVYPIPGPLGRDLTYFYQTSTIEFLASTVGSFVVGDFNASQTISYMDTATPVYGAPMPLPIPPFARFLRWNGNAPGNPNFAIAQFALNL